MTLDTQTTIFMICFVYLMLHGAIWLALLEYRSFQVKLWCASGMISGVAVVLLAIRGSVPDVVFFYVAQFLMLLGNWGRMVALRLYLPKETQRTPFTMYALMNAAYFAAFCALIYFHQAEWEALMLFNGFYALLCFDYYRIGEKLSKQHTSFGAQLLMWAGLTFTITLGVRTLGVAMLGDLHDIYAPTWDQAVMVAGQFTAITLSNIAFLRIFLEIAERKKVALTHELAVTSGHANAMRENSMALKQLLQEREEIIRQLAMFNKTAGMGALVASLAHELNQPLTAIQLNAEWIDSTLVEDDTVKSAMQDLMKDNQRAATIIKTLRNMFGSGRKVVSTFDLNELVHDVLLLCQARIRSSQIALKLDLHSHPVPITGDKSQLQQVLLNLFTNAIDALTDTAAVHPQKRIAIATQLDGSVVRIDVTDNGTGIAPDIADAVFELLRTNKIEGMGVGLWLSKTIVEAHHGTIAFITRANVGTTFTVTLPATTQEMIY